MNQIEPLVLLLSKSGLALQFNLNIDEVAAASQVFDNWRKDTSTPAYIEVHPCITGCCCTPVPLFMRSIVTPAYNQTGLLLVATQNLSTQPAVHIHTHTSSVSNSNRHIQKDGFGSSAKTQFMLTCVSSMVHDRCI